MPEQSAFVHGGVTYPLPLRTGNLGTGNSLLRDADPSLYFVLAYFKSVITTYVGARLVQAASDAGLATGQNALANAVQYVIPYDPEEVVREQQIGKWPLLAVWRETGKYRWRTVARMETKAVWRIAYVLPPLTGSQLERIAPILNSVPKVLLNRIEQKFDPAFMNGADFMALAGLDELNLTEDAWGTYELPQAQIKFPVWMGKLEVIERDGNLPASATGGPMTGVDIAIDLNPGDGQPVMPDVVDMQIDFRQSVGQLGTPGSLLGRIRPGAF